QLLVVLRDRPAPRVILVQRQGLPAAVRLAPQAHGRHVLGVGPEREAPLAAEPGPAVEQLFPSGAGHGKLHIGCSPRLRVSLYPSPPTPLPPRGEGSNVASTSLSRPRAPLWKGLPP